MSKFRRSTAPQAAAGVPHSSWRRAGVLFALACAVILTVIGVVIWFCRGSPGTAPPALADLLRPGVAAGFNVLLVTLDTVRQDRLGCYGHKLAETPTCDDLAAHGVLFEDAVCSAPLTLPSHATLFTGLYPHHHGVRDNGIYRLATEHVTLATTLKAHGYDTAAFVGCFIVDTRFGLSQGFDVYDFQVASEGYRPINPNYNERPAGAVTDAAIGWLRGRDQAEARRPFFMWVHYFDAHRPYTSPLLKEARFAERGYDAEIAYADQNLGRLRDELARLGLWQRTLVVLTADHGESLGEHKEPTHGLLLYGATVRVPLIFSCAALFPAPARINGQIVGLVDVRPTIEDLLGFPPGQPLDGQSLARRGTDAGRAIYMETMTPLNLAGWSPLHALCTHTGKFIRAPEPEYYDLIQDPRELNNLYPVKAAQVAPLAQALEQSMRSTSPGRDAARTLSDEEMRRLGSLGYVQGPAADPDAELDDPKAMMDVYNQGLAAEELYMQGQYNEAAATAQEVLAVCPGCVQARRVLAFSRLKLGQPAEAVALLRAGVDRKRDTFLIQSLAQALILSNELTQAWETLALFEAADPTDGRVPLLRGDILVRQKRLAEAITYFEAAIRMDEGRVGPMARERIARIQGATTPP